MAKQLPPDPDNLNDSRAEWAGAALAAFQAKTGSEDGFEAVTDLLCDLRHWCDRNGVSFTSALDFARINYADETIPGRR